LTFLRDILGKTSPPETDESIAVLCGENFLRNCWTGWSVLSFLEFTRVIPNN